MPPQGNLLDPATTPDKNMQFCCFGGACEFGRGTSLGPAAASRFATAGNESKKKTRPFFFGATRRRRDHFGLSRRQLEGVLKQILNRRSHSSVFCGLMQLGVDTLPRNSPKNPGDRTAPRPCLQPATGFEFPRVGSTSQWLPRCGDDTILGWLNSLPFISSEVRAKIAAGEFAAKSLQTPSSRDHGSKMALFVFGEMDISRSGTTWPLRREGWRTFTNTADALSVLQRHDVREWVCSEWGAEPCGAGKSLEV